MRRKGHLWQCKAFAGGWEMWRCARCGRWAVPSVFGFLWPDYIGPKCKEPS